MTWRSPHPRARWLALVVVFAALWHPAVASAHAFPIQSEPAAGSRLATAPRQLVLRFSEPFVSSSAHISVRDAGGRVVASTPLSVEGAVVRQPFPATLRGVFVVSWRVLADDGHLSAGEFAFAVATQAELPMSRSSISARTPASQVVASWVLFLGFALAFGVLVAEFVVWKGALVRARPGSLLVPLGLALAALGALVGLVLVSRDRVGRSIGSALAPSALSDAIGTRPGGLSTAVLGVLAIAAVLTVSVRTRGLAVVVLAAIPVLVALRGHAGTSGHGWAVIADAIHFAGAALWIGALALLVVLVAGSGREGLEDGVRRYSRLALPTVLVVLSTGVVSAWAELERVSDLLDTRYGRTLLVKSVLVLAALMLAGVGRLVLGGNPRLGWGALRASTRVEVGALILVLAAAALLTNLAPPRSSAAVAQAVGPALGSRPAVRLAELAGQLVVGLAASERELEFRIVAPGSAPPDDARLSVDAERPDGSEADLYPRSCGNGCFTIRFRLPEGTTRITAHVKAAGWEGGEARFAVPAPLPPDRSGDLGRVIRAIRAVPLLTLVERVSSGPSSVAAPAQYTLSGKAFLATEPFAGGAVDVRLLGRGGGLRQLSFALPASNVWYRLWIDTRDRIRRELILSPGHRIARTFSYPAGQTAPGALATAGALRPPVAVFTLGREADDLAVGLGATPNGGRLRLTVSVVDGSGKGKAGLNVAFRLRTAEGETNAAGVSCGAGCYRSDPPLRGRPRVVLVRLERLGRSPLTLRFPFPERWPPRSAAAIARRATAVFGQLRSVIIRERLASTATQALSTIWTLEAPDRLAYSIARGSQAVVIGSRRWDRDPGGRWQRSEISPMRQPTAVWVRPPRRAALIGSRRSGGRETWVISFLDPGVPAWFTVAVDKRTFRPLELRMVAPAHFMHHRYSRFDQAPKIVPPR